MSYQYLPCDGSCLVQSCSSFCPCLSPLLPLEDILDEGLGLVLHSPDDTGDDRVNLMAESPADSLEDETDSAHKVRDHLLWRFIIKSLLEQSVWLNCSRMSFWFWFTELDILVYFVAGPFQCCFYVLWPLLLFGVGKYRLYFLIWLVSCGVRGWLKSDGWLRALCHVI